MNELTKDEKTYLTSEQEKEYLELQKELLSECLERGDSCEEDVSWEVITEKISTLNVNYKKSGIMEISGKTW